MTRRAPERSELRAAPSPFSAYSAIRWILGFCCVWITQLVLAADELETRDARLIGALRERIPQAMRLDGTPGLNIALARRGKVIWEEGFGYADVETKTPMTPYTLMRAGSMTKPYTATAVMQLVEKGIVGLDEPVNRYLRAFQLHNPLGEREITVRDLLTHRSGLSGNNAHSDFAPPPALERHLEAAAAKGFFEDYLGTQPVRWSAEVGERAQYSNHGTAILGYLVEVTNPERLSFSDYVQRHILDVLQMTSSRLPAGANIALLEPDLRDRMATGYARFGPIWLPTPEVSFGDFPCGGLVTTPGENIRLLLAFLNHGRYAGRSLVRSETVDLMLTPQVRDFRKGSDLGLIWFLGNRAGAPGLFGHSGAHMYGWQGTFRAYPDHDTALALTTNRWQMLSDGNPNGKSVIQEVTDFVESWLSHENDQRRATSRESWAWKVSYVIGLSMTEQLKGRLGIPSALTSEKVESMAQGAQVQSEIGAALWDAKGFRTGVADLLAIPMKPDALHAFMISDRIRVTPDELALIQRQLDGVVRIPFAAE